MNFFELGDFPLTSGATLPGARLAYQSFGELNAARDNAVIFPTILGAPPEVLNGWIGEGRALDPRKYLIVLPGHFGLPPSSAPSNTEGDFPEVSIADDVIAQHRLMTEVFGADGLHLALGWSVGSLQVYEWALRYGEAVRRIAPIAGAPTPPPWTKLWLRTVVEEPLQGADDGLRRVAHGSALTAPPRTFFHDGAEVWPALGFDSLDAFVSGFWENFWLPQDPRDVAAQARKARTSWPGRPGESLESALSRISARTTIAALTGDNLFPPAELERLATLIPGATYRQIDSVFGHLATFALSADDVKAIDDSIQQALES
ncbi:MAG: alpha/beta fold hydrolase [Nonomuraea sp.]|nr:alpha/beta fold hydrolase [Nonomuraea sp.]